MVVQIWAERWPNVVYRRRLWSSQSFIAARDAHFLLGLQRSGIAFTAADMPNASRVTVSIMAVVAEKERPATSERPKAALAAAKVNQHWTGTPRQCGLPLWSGIEKPLDRRVPTSADTNPTKTVIPWHWNRKG
jgi:hypothetical protein